MAAADIKHKHEEVHCELKSDEVRCEHREAVCKYNTTTISVMYNLTT